MLVLTLCYRIIGFVREMLVASYLGTSAEADAYSIAYSVPTVVVEMLALGAIGSASIAVFQSVLQKDGKQRLNQLYSRVMAAILLALAALLLLCELGAPLLTKLMAPSFSGEKMALTVSMVRSMLPVILFVGVLGLQKAALNLMGDFRSEGISNVVFNCAMVAGVLFAARQDRIDILIHSFIAAAFLQWLVQFRSVRRVGLRPSPDLHLRDEDLHRIFVLLIPIMFSTVVSQISPVAARAVASTCEDGAVAMLNYAYKVTMLPIGVFGGAIATASFPRISRYANESSSKLGDLSAGVFRLSLLLFIPMVAVMMAGSVPIINIMFERGVFTAADTRETARLLCAYAPTVLLTGLVQTLNNEFYAFKRTREPILVNCACVAGSILLSIPVSGVCGAWGIPLSFSAGQLANAVALGVMADRLSPGMAKLPLRGAAVCAAAFGVMCAATAGVSLFYTRVLYERSILLRLGCFGVFGCVLMAAYLLLIYKGNVLGFRDTLRLFRSKDEPAAKPERI